MNLSPVAEFLETLRGRRVYFDALHGNHGDRLLSVAAHALLTKAPVNLVATPQSSDFILVNGGGSMADGWFGLERLAFYCRDFPGHELAVLPSSYYLQRTRLPDIVGHRTAPLWLWARERASLNVLAGAAPEGRTHLRLDHDLAFSLAGTPLVESLRRTPGRNSLLVVERDDWEGPTGRTRPFSPPGLGFIPGNIRTGIRRTLLGPIRRRQDRNSRFFAAAAEFARRRHPRILDSPPVVADISLAETCGFEQFLAHVAGASVIVTTRLHVAILGHLLQRQVYLVDGRYHKFRGVFDMSMQHGSTEMLAWDGQELRTASIG